MSLLLSIDPGVTCPGAAMICTDRGVLAARYFNGGVFSRCGLTATRVLARDILQWATEGGARVDALALEWPQIYGGRRSGGRKDPNDMLPLAALDGALAYAFSALDVDPPAHYTPHQWKGSKKKNPTARMVLDRLTPAERANIAEIHAFEEALTAAESKGVECEHPTMNAIDAVGIGLFHLGRFNRKRVIAR